MDVLAGAAGALAVGRCAMVVELQRHADDVIALGLEQRRRHRRIDAAGHGDDDAGVLRSAFEVEAVEHSGRGCRRAPSIPGIKATAITIGADRGRRNAMRQRRQPFPERFRTRQFLPGGGQRPRSQSPLSH